MDSSLHVDDFGIFNKSKNMENIEFRLQRSLDKVETWATEKGLYEKYCNTPKRNRNAHFFNGQYMGYCHI